MIIDSHTHNPHSPHAVIAADVTGFSPSDGFFYSLGLHPWNLHQPHAATEFAQITAIASQCPQVLAIGETGLDPNATAPIDLQMQWLERHIALAEECRKPLIIHCVRRTADIISLHRTHKPSMPWIIHGFRANLNVARTLIDEGIYISIGQRFNPLAVAAIPANLLLVETDESAISINQIIADIASCRRVTPADVEKAAIANALTCFAQ